MQHFVPVTVPGLGWAARAMQLRSGELGGSAQLAQGLSLSHRDTAPASCHLSSTPINCKSEQGLSKQDYLCFSWLDDEHADRHCTQHIWEELNFCSQLFCKSAVSHPKPRLCQMSFFFLVQRTALS